MAYLVMKDVVLQGSAFIDFEVQQPPVIHAGTEPTFDGNPYNPIAASVPIRNSRFGQLYPPRREE